MLINCNEGCKKDFTLTAPMKEELDGEVERHYIKCPHCGKEYDSYYTDSELRELQEQMQELKAKAPFTEKQMKRYNKLKKKAVRKSNTLKEMYASE